MASNIVDSSIGSEGTGNISNNVSPPEMEVRGSYPLNVFQSTLNILAHILIGVVVGVNLIFVFRQTLPLGPTPLLIVLCVLGYQLLMAEPILSLSPSNGWSANLRLVDMKRIHTILQVMGSGLAIAGSIIIALNKTVNWNTLHGQFGLVAMVFTAVGLLNGLTSLYAYELRKYIPGRLSKITHTCFGIVAFVASCICLCYGFAKMSFKRWATPPLAYTMMGMTACFTFIIIIDPAINFYSKSKRVFKK